MRPHLYVAGPMTGYPDDNFPAFEQAARALRAAGYEVTSPHEVPGPDGSVQGSLPWAAYARSDLIAMLQNAAQRVYQATALIASERTENAGE